MVRTKIEEAQVVDTEFMSENEHRSWHYFDLLLDTPTYSGVCSHGYGLHLLSDGYVEYWTDESAGCGGVHPGVFSDTPVNNGNWHHIVATYDFSLYFYIDGDLQLGMKDNPYIKTGLSILIGLYRGSQAYSYAGTIDEIRIYNRVLSAAEIEALYNLP